MAKSIDFLYRLQKQEDWKSVARVTRRMLTNEPDSHWLLSTLSHAYYEQRHYERALDFAEASLELAPHCPLVLRRYAAALDMLGEEEKAIAIWKRTISRGEENLAFGECGEGIRDAKSTIIDFLFRIGDSYAYLGKRSLAKRYLKKHLEMRTRGTRSTYDIREARRLLKSLE